MSSTYRITTNGLYRNYRTNLNSNNKKLNDAMTAVQKQRKFNTYAEDPAAASKAWRLRRSYWLAGDQIDNNNYLISKYESAHNAMSAVVDGDVGNGEYGLSLEGILSAVEGASGTAGSSRTALGKQLLQSSESMVSMMNSKYGDDFIFAGADGDNIPFAWSADGGKLLYRGVDVNTEKPRTAEEFNLKEADLTAASKAEKALKETASPLMTDDEVKEIKSLIAKEDGGLTDAEKTKLDGFKSLHSDEYKALKKVSAFEAYQTDYASRNGVSYEQGAKDYAKLEKMAGETNYIDIGLGMQEDDNGKIITGSAFNGAISGLTFLGYGRDENLAVVVRELGEIFSRSDPETGEYTQTGDAERADELLDRLHDAVRYSQGQHVQLNADAKYLNTNLKQLQTTKDQLDNQIVDTEDKDMAEAITEMTWAQYCYNAALRIGTNILSQSLIDYMS